MTLDSLITEHMDEQVRNNLEAQLSNPEISEE